MNSCNKFVLFVFVIVEDVHDNGIHNFLQFLPPIGRKNSQILKVAVSNTSNWILDLIRCLYTPALCEYSVLAYAAYPSELLEFP